MDISIAVMAHPRRLAPASDLAVALDADLVLDAGHDDEWDTGARAWDIRPGNSDFHIVIQDDGIPVPDFRAEAANALAVHRPPIASLYLGRDYPERYQPHIGRATAAADAAGASWIVGPRVFHGVALAIRSELVDDMLTYCELRTEPYDERISKWAMQRSHEVHYSWPSLVDHNDQLPSLVKHADGGREPGRRAWRHGVAASWATETVVMR